MLGYRLLKPAKVYPCTDILQLAYWQVGLFAVCKYRCHAIYPDFRLVVITPIELLKSKLQMQTHATVKQFTGPIDCARQIVKARGIPG